MSVQGEGGQAREATPNDPVHLKMALLTPTLDMVLTGVLSLLLLALALVLLCFFTCRLARPLR